MSVSALLKEGPESNQMFGAKTPLGVNEPRTPGVAQFQSALAGTGGRLFQVVNTARGFRMPKGMSFPRM